MSHSDVILGVITAIGALFIGYLGYENITVKATQLQQNTPMSSAWKKGIITNFLSPHPYIFWIAVGAPTVLKATTISLLAAGNFIVGFYLLLVGSKIIVAVLTDKSKDILQNHIYVIIIRLLARISHQVLVTRPQPLWQSNFGVGQNRLGLQQSVLSALVCFASRPQALSSASL